MPHRLLPQNDQILTVAQMRETENALIAAGSSVEALMRIAGLGAAEWVWRVSAGRPVTVLCGPGNNGGDGYVIAQAIRERGGPVTVVAACEPKTDAAHGARSRYQGKVQEAAAGVHGDVLVDCLYGSGLSRPLSPEDFALLAQLAKAHHHRIALDLPSGVRSDTGMLLNEGLPHYDATLALGAWKFAHVLMPAASMMGELRQVPIGAGPIEGAARMLGKPHLAAPPADSHKYRRGLLAVVGGAMPGASILASIAAQGSGAGYVKLFADHPTAVPADVVVNAGRLSDVLTDNRNTAILVGSGLGRDAHARERLAVALADPVPVVLDGDALVLLAPRMLAERKADAVATPHEGELLALERAFDCDGNGSKVARSIALARASGMVIVAKGPDTVIASPDGRVACAPRASSWLSTAGSGDVLAGCVGSRLATGIDSFTAACEGVWLHGEAARISKAAFSASQLADKVPAALAACL